jgi:hypothetical protein
VFLSGEVEYEHSKPTPKGAPFILRCSLELKPILPPEIYTPLEESEFEKLRDAVKKLFEEWL